MKSLSLVMCAAMVLIGALEGDACRKEETKTIFSESFPELSLVMRLAEQCVEKPAPKRLEGKGDDGWVSALLKRNALSAQLEEADIPIWTTWAMVDFQSFFYKPMDSIYILTLIREGNVETVWTRRIFGTDALPSTWPVPFYVGDVVQQQNTVWVFFWKEPYYYLDRQEKQHGEWNKTASLRLERPYANETHATILVDGEHVGVTLILENATYEPHSATLAAGEQPGVKLTLQDGTEEYWRLEGEHLVKEAQK